MNGCNPPKALKVFTIGGSFTADAMNYLWEIAREAGVEEIVLGYVYYGGGTLQQHADNIRNDEPAYIYFKNTNGTWEANETTTIETAITDEEWDYIALQQTSGKSGHRSSYDVLPELIEYVRSRRPNATLIWHMTWAYQQDSTHRNFPSYDNDQMNMYNMILDCLENVIMTEENGFALFIPNMTAIQNARTSFLGDRLTRDGYHLNKNIGRYIAALSYYAAITGDSIDRITYNPNPDAITADMQAAAREAVKNAIANPMTVTPSKITEGEWAE